MNPLVKHYQLMREFYLRKYRYYKLLNDRKHGGQEAV